MEEGTLGSIKRHPSLACLNNHIPLLSLNKRQYLLKFINEFNTYLNKVKKIEDINLRIYVLSLMKKDYKFRTLDLYNKYHIDIVTHLQNYITGRLRSAINLK